MTNQHECVQELTPEGQKSRLFKVSWSINNQQHTCRVVVHRRLHRDNISFKNQAPLPQTVFDNATNAIKRLLKRRKTHS